MERLLAALRPPYLGISPEIAGDSCFDCHDGGSFSLISCRLSGVEWLLMPVSAVNLPSGRRAVWRFAGLSDPRVGIGTARGVRGR